MSKGNERAVARLLSDALDCAVEARRAEDAGQTLFIPADPQLGRLQLDEAWARAAPEPELLERLRRDGVSDLLRRGERVHVSAVATEILPRR